MKLIYSRITLKKIYKWKTVTLNFYNLYHTVSVFQKHKKIIIHVKNPIDVPEETNGKKIQILFWILGQWAEQLYFIWEDDRVSISVTTAGFGSVVVDRTRWLHWVISSLWSVICVTRCSGYGSESEPLRDQRQTIPTSSEVVSTELSDWINSSSVEC